MVEHVVVRSPSKHLSPEWEAELWLLMFTLRPVSAVVPENNWISARESLISGERPSSVEFDDRPSMTRYNARNILMKENEYYQQ